MSPPFTFLRLEPPRTDDHRAEVATPRPASALFGAIARRTLPLRWRRAVQTDSDAAPVRKTRNLLLADPAWLTTQYVTLGRRTIDVAADIGCPRGAVHDALLRHGIPRRPPGALRRYPQLADRAWLAAQISRGRTARAIAAELGCGTTTVNMAVSRHRLPARPKGRTVTYPQLADRKWLTAQRAAGRTVAEIAELVGCSPAGVSAALARHRIEGRQPRVR